MKKLFIFMATVLLAFAVGCQTGTGSDAGKDSDTSKESAAFTYEVTDEGTICITGVTDESVSELVIPKKIDGKPVTEIGRYAFYGCENLKSVELTNVVKIGKGAFSGCVNLESVSMPKAEIIKDKAFLNCAKLTPTAPPTPTVAPVDIVYLKTPRSEKPLYSVPMNRITIQRMAKKKSNGWYWKKQKIVCW